MASTLLDNEIGFPSEDSLLQSFQAKIKDPISILDDQQSISSVRIIPQPGFCLKTSTDKKEKAFINVCKSDKVPSPRDVSDEELADIIQSGDPMRYRVPMSIGEPHVEVDNAGNGCTAYDVIINSDFYTKTQERPILLNFILTLILEGIEQKNSVLLSRECKILKNRKVLGTLHEQFVRQKAKPRIVEVEADKEEKETLEPEYTIVQEPPEGVAQYLVVEVKLPKVNSAGSLALDIGEDRLVLSARPNLYHMDIDLPYLLNTEEVGAQFNKLTKVLTVTLQVNGVAPY